MQQHNVKEYEFIRKELSDLRNCITTYMGFVIGGTGVAFLSTSTITVNEDLTKGIVFAFFISTIIVSLVLMILFYKFNSHNRYAGYCKLLNQEKYQQSQEIEQFLSWEVCMDKLRESDVNIIDVYKKIISTNIFKKPVQHKKEILELFGSKCFLCRLFIGIWLIIKTIFGHGKTKSWNFPLYVITAFLVIELLFLGTGLYYNCNLPIEQSTNFLSIFIYVIISIQLFIWGLYFVKTYELMKGKATVEAYCWRFLPLRIDYIKKYDNEFIKYEIIFLN